jgi:hypothetical protein
MMAKIKRIKVVEKICHVCFHDVFDLKTPDEVIEKIEHYKSLYEGREIFFDVSYDYFDGTKQLELKERRLETDKEFEERVELESMRNHRKKMDLLAKEEKERKEYERLKNKFG